MSEQSAVTQAETARIPFPETNIPDNSLVTSQISILPQSIQVHYDELSSHFAWMKEQAASGDRRTTILKGASMTKNNLEPGEERWKEIVDSGEDVSYTLGKSLDEDTNTCFQRSVFFNVLMQQAQVPVATMEGVWVESERPDLKQEPESILTLKAGGYLISPQDRSEGHLWNVVQDGNDTYLVDTSYLVTEGDKQHPVIQKIEHYKPEQKYFRITLPLGQVRHYIADGQPKVEPLPQAAQSIGTST